MPPKEKKAQKFVVLEHNYEMFATVTGEEDLIEQIKEFATVHGSRTEDIEIYELGERVEFEEIKTYKIS